MFALHLFPVLCLCFTCSVKSEQNWLTAAYQQKKRMSALQGLKNKLKINIEKEKDVSWIGSCKSQS